MGGGGCIQGVPKKRNGGFSVHCKLKMSYVLTSLYEAPSAEENDTKIIKFGWVILNLCPLLEIQSVSNFAGFLRPMSEELCRDRPSIWCLVEAFHKTPWGRSVPTQVFAHRSEKSSEISKWLYFKKNGHSIKITQPNLMILVSFSSADDTLSNDIKKHNTFSSQSTENPPFRFLWDTRYSTP